MLKLGVPDSSHAIALPEACVVTVLRSSEKMEPASLEAGMAKKTLVSWSKTDDPVDKSVRA